MASTAAVLNILVNAQTGAAQAQLSLLDKRLKKTAATATGTSGALGGMFGKMPKGAAGAAGAVALVGVAAAVVGKQLYDLGGEYDKAFDKIRTTTGQTGRPLKKLEADFKSVYGTVPAGMDDVAEAIGGVNVRLGLTGKPLKKMSRALLELSEVTGSDLTTNVKNVSRAFVDWEVPLKKQSKTLDGFYRLQQKSGATVADMTSDVQKFGSPLRTLGFTIGEAASMFATFEKAGVNAQTMVPGFKLAIGNLIKPTSEIAGTFDKLGIQVGKPEQGLKKVMKLLGDKSTLSTTDKLNLAMQVFGKRAGADMAEAIKQGRFNLDTYMKTFKSGGETIHKSAKDTRDAGDNFKIFGHKVQNALEPFGTAIWNGVNRLSEILAKVPINRIAGDIRRFVKTNEDFKDVLKAVGVALRGFGVAAKFGFAVAKDALRSLFTYFKGAMQAIRGIIKIVSGVLTGNFGKAWDGVKDIFFGAVKVVLGVVRTATAPMRAVTKAVGKGITSVFHGVWGKVKSIFESGANAVIGVVNAIISAINAIPGIPDIGKIGTIGGGGGGGDNGPFKLFARGGKLEGGKPSGDSIPALLERGEYVLNRNAVKKVGVDKLDQVNFKAASRFQSGGPVGMIGGGLSDAVSGAAGAVAGAAGAVAGAGANLLGAGAGKFIGMLPKPNIPQPFTGVGPYVIDAAKEYIKEKVAELFAASGSGNFNYTGPPADMKKLGDNAWVDTHTYAAANYIVGKFGNSISSNYRTAAENAAANGSPTSSHMRGSPANPGAFDFVPASEEVQAWIGQHIAGVTENDIHDYGSGLHNHVAFFRKGGLINRIAKMAAGGVIKGRVSYFGGQGTAGGKTADSDAGLALNLNAGTDSGWNNAKTQKWMAASIAGNPYYADVGIEGHSAILPIIDLGPAGWVNRSIDVTTPGVGKMGFSPASSFPTDAVGEAWLLGQTTKTRKGSPSDDGSGGGPSAAEKKAAASKRRIDKRGGIIDTMRKAVQGADGKPKRLDALWDLVGAYGKFGKFDKDSKSHVIDKVRQASGTLNPVGGISVLSNLADYLREHVNISGEEGTNENFIDRLRKVQNKAGGRAARKRGGILSTIKSNGLDYPFKNRLTGMEGILASLDEQFQLAETMARSEAGPGGSDLTNSEKAQQIDLLTSIQGNQGTKKNWLIGSIASLYKKETAVRDQMFSAAPAGSKTHWKYDSLKAAAKSTRASINLLTGDEGSGLIGLIGLTGQGGDMFDTKMSLADLGVSTTVESAAAADNQSSIADLLRQSLAASNRNLAIANAQMPIFQQFMPKYHSGGVIPGSGERPAMVMGGEGVFTREQMSAMGGSGEIIVNVIVEDGAVDKNKIRAEAISALNGVVRGAKNGPAIGRKTSLSA